jgi:hypothetical protein
MPAPLPEIKGTGAGWITAGTLQKFVDSIRTRTPVPGDGLLSTEAPDGIHFKVDRSAVGAGTEYIHPWKVEISGGNPYVNRGIASIPQAGYEVELGNATVGTGDDGVIFLDVTGTTTDGYFAASSVALDHDASTLPTDTDTHKYFLIATLTGGVIDQDRRSDFFF